MEQFLRDHVAIMRKEKIQIIKFSPPFPQRDYLFSLFYQ